MTLTDKDTGNPIEISKSMVCAIYDRGAYREVRTKDNELYAQIGKYKVTEPIPEIMKKLKGE